MDRQSVADYQFNLWGMHWIVCNHQARDYQHTIYIIDAILDAILNVKEIISNWGYRTLIDVNEIISGLSRCCRPPAKSVGPPSHCVNEDHWQTCWVPQLDYRTKRLKKDYGTAHSNEIINTIAGPMRSGAWTKDATFFQHDGSSARDR